MADAALTYAEAAFSDSEDSMLSSKHRCIHRQTKIASSIATTTSLAAFFLLQFASYIAEHSDRVSSCILELALELVV